VLRGVTESQVGAEGQRGEELSHAYAGTFHPPIVPATELFQNARWEGAATAAMINTSSGVRA
jgi:hypothetical protein